MAPENKELTMLDILIRTHEGLERQGPGSAEMTEKALGFLGDLNKIAKAADLGCGTGGQTMVLARHIPGRIVGLDQLPDLIDRLNDSAKKQNFHSRITGVVGSMEALPFEKEEFDLIWSEGAIDAIGFERGLSHWHSFLKNGGYAAVTCPSWLTDKRPAEVEVFWSEAGSHLDSVGHNIGNMQKCGYSFVAAFALPGECWTENYFIPRGAAENALLEKHPGNETVEAYIANSKYEAALYAKYGRQYGYVFYIGKKM
jgi:SAM-dependent methyltransferase